MFGRMLTLFQKQLLGFYTWICSLFHVILLVFMVGLLFQYCTAMDALVFWVKLLRWYGLCGHHLCPCNEFQMWSPHLCGKIVPILGYLELFMLGWKLSRLYISLIIWNTFWKHKVYFQTMAKYSFRSFCFISFYF